MHVRCPCCREVVSLLRELKKQATLLVVSHDLADIAPLVDCAWRMQVRGDQRLQLPDVAAVWLDHIMHLFNNGYDGVVSHSVTARDLPSLEVGSCSTKQMKHCSRLVLPFNDRVMCVSASFAVISCRWVGKWRACSGPLTACLMWRTESALCLGV